MTSPVPYESRVRPLIAAATPAPWLRSAHYPTEINNGRFLICKMMANVAHDATLYKDRDLIVTAVNCAAASADLAEAVRGAVNEAGQEIVFEGARCVVVSPEAIDALRAALSRLDAAAGAP